MGLVLCEHEAGRARALLIYSYRLQRLTPQGLVSYPNTTSIRPRSHPIYLESDCLPTVTLQISSTVVLYPLTLLYAKDI